MFSILHHPVVLLIGYVLKFSVGVLLLSVIANDWYWRARHERARAQQQRLQDLFDGVNHDDGFPPEYY